MVSCNVVSYERVLTVIRISGILLGKTVAMAPKKTCDVAHHSRKHQVALHVKDARELAISDRPCHHGKLVAVAT